MEKSAKKIKGEQRLVVRYAKCQIEGCGGNIIPSMTFNKIPLCPKHTDIAKCLIWILNNLQIDKKVINPQQTGTRIPVTSEGLGKMSAFSEGR